MQLVKSGHYETKLLDKSQAIQGLAAYDRFHTTQFLRPMPNQKIEHFHFENAQAPAGAGVG
jgi:hypothetical protein